MLIYHLLYRSTSKGFLSEDQIKSILIASNRNNRAANITGLLLFKDKTFLQLLEGDENSVQALLAKIKLDPRHGSIDVLLDVKSMKRIFPDWSMGFIPTEKTLGELGSIKPILEATAAHGKIDRSLIIPILKKFVADDTSRSIFE